MTDEQSKEVALEIDLGPNDLLIVHTDRKLTMEQMTCLRANLDHALSTPGRKAIVLDAGMWAVVAHRTDDAPDDEGGEEPEHAYL